MSMNKFLNRFIIALLLFILPSELFSENNLSLQESEGWSITQIAPGQTWYLFKGFYVPHNANQIVNVTEIDLNYNEYNVIFKYTTSDTLSHVASMIPNAVAGINGTYLEIVDEKSTSFLKSDGEYNRTVEISPDNLYFWKHEGAFYYDKSNNKIGIEYGNNDTYMSWNYPNIISGSPILINNYNPVGEAFVKNTGNISQLPDENPDKHQGIRHPRTAIALTSDNKLLLITVDGRRSESSGMTAKEFTQFIARYFNPKDALNLDGGGSTTMWIKNSGMSPTNVVNYPTDNNRFDHFGQRRHRNFLIITRTDTNFSGGDGSESNPYLIGNAAQLLNIHSLDWSVNSEPYFKLINDIDMEGIEWSPINPYDPYNKRLHFDGNGHIIKNLTCQNKPYASLFGVLCGSCKNLGLINVNIRSTNGAGAFGGYIGLANPTSIEKTGILENCYSSGVVIGNAGVGGLVGNIGKPYTTAQTVVKNCYSTCRVIGYYSNSSPQAGGARAGGIAGIIWTGGILENSYATGTVIAENLYGAGGLIGYSDAGIKSCVAWNDSVIIKTTNGGSNNGKIGCVTAYTHPTNAQPQNNNVWSSSSSVLMIDNNQIQRTDFSTPSYSYHGEAKSDSELNIFNFYAELNWDFVSDENSWAQTPSKGYPIHQWLFNRGDYSELDGHPNTIESSIEAFKQNSLFNWYIKDSAIHFLSDLLIEKIYIISQKGESILLLENPHQSNSFVLPQKGVLILQLIIQNKTYTLKIIN